MRFKIPVLIISLLLISATAVLALDPITLSGPALTPRKNGHTMFRWDVENLPNPPPSGLIVNMVNTTCGDTSSRVFKFEDGSWVIVSSYQNKDLKHPLYEMANSTWKLIKSDGSIWASGSTQVPVCKL